MIAHRLYPFRQGCDDRLRFSISGVTGSRTTWATDEVHSHHFAMHGYHDWRMLVVAQCVCGKGDRILEVGANVGTETVGFSDVVGPTGNVVAFEAFPGNIAKLKQTLGSIYPQAEVVSFAVSDCEGEMNFVPPEVEGYTGTGYLGNVSGVGPATQVRAVTLDQFLPSDVAVQFLMMDVEGAEIAVLRGARAAIHRCRPVIALEANSKHALRAGTSLQEIDRYLRDLHYCVKAIRRLGLRAPDTSAVAEPCNWVAVPAEKRELLPSISRRIFWCGLLPPWWGINPMVAKKPWLIRPVRFRRAAGSGDTGPNSV